MAFLTLYTGVNIRQKGVRLEWHCRGSWRSTGVWGISLGAYDGRRDACGVMLPDGGVDFRVRAFVKTQLDLSREPSLADDSRTETFLG